jgi:hypothetical protein
VSTKNDSAKIQSSGFLPRISQEVQPGDDERSTEDEHNRRRFQFQRQPDVVEQGNAHAQHACLQQDEQQAELMNAEIGEFGASR